MPVDTSSVDIVSIFKSRGFVQCGRKPTQTHDNTGEDEYHGSCPWCGGRDRFMFRDPGGRWSCKIRSSGCGRYGRDVIDFVQQYDGKDFIEACEELRIDPGVQYIHAGRAKRSIDDVKAPSEKWRERAEAVARKARLYLWSQQGAQALEYLRRRGFTDETIKRYHLGYVPFVANSSRWHMDSLDLWGLEKDFPDENGVWLPEGILIPWYIGGAIWKLNIRRLNGIRSKTDAKYIPVLGSAQALYLADSIDPERPAVLCESELDAISGDQDSAGQAAFVATGPTTHARRARWIARLSWARYVLVAYDDDQDDKRNGKRAGDSGAGYWLLVLRHAIRWLPWLHDLNDMLTQGVSINQWLSTGCALAEKLLEAASPAEKSPTKEEALSQEQGQQEPGQEQAEETTECTPATCTDYEISVDGEACVQVQAGSSLCGTCLDAGRETPALYSDGEDMFCEVHYQANREQTSIEGKQEECMTKEQIVNQIASVFGDCRIEWLDVNIETFLAQRRREINEANNKVCAARILAQLQQATTCQYHAHLAKSMQCKRPVIAGTGWCEEHRYAASILDYGARYRYRALRVSEALTIEEGPLCWLAYASMARPDRVLKVKRAIVREERRTR